MTPGAISDAINRLTVSPAYVEMRDRRDALKVQLQRLVLGEADFDDYTVGREAELRRQIAKLSDDLNSLLENGMKTVLTC